MFSGFLLVAIFFEVTIETGDIEKLFTPFKLIQILSEKLENFEIF
jgi:hypothetical protein